MIKKKLECSIDIIVWLLEKQQDALLPSYKNDGLVSEEEDQQQLIGIHIFKSEGLYLCVLKELAENFSYPFRLMFNTSWNNDAIAQDWKDASVQKW